jgi:hypothetical protein
MVLFSGAGKADVYITCLMADRLDVYYDLKKKGFNWPSLPISVRRSIVDSAKKRYCSCLCRYGCSL